MKWHIWRTWQPTAAAVALALVLSCSTSAQAGIIATWTFENSVPTTGGPHSPEAGAGSATSVHAVAATFSSPAGNGSAKSFSANNWSSGDYFQFQVSTVGVENIAVSFDQTRSSTGPGAWDFQYSTDGSSFTTFVDDYVVLLNGGAPNATWSSGGARQAGYTFSVDLSAIAALDNDGSIFFRLTSAVTAAPAGTARVDNFEVRGDALNATAVPEPSTLALLGLGGLTLVGRLARRRR